MTVRRTQEELLAELRKRFGESPMNWAFQCPACKDIATGQDFRDAIRNDPKRNDRYASDFLGQVCIGRVLGALRVPAEEWRGRGCDWAAGGLIKGPDFVVTPDGAEVPCFPIAEKVS